MQIPYRKVTFEDVGRLVAWCKDYSTPRGGLFEIYEDPGGINRIMVIVNSVTWQEDGRMLRPLGTFYCNYMAPGVISLDDHSENEEMPLSLININRIKRIIDRLLQEACPGAHIDLSFLDR